MNRNYRALSTIAIVIVVITASCKTSTTAVSATDANLASMDQGDMHHISRTLRKDLEDFFQEFSELSFDQEEKRQEQIEYGLTYFHNNETPVLIVVNLLDDQQKIYDEPMTIVNYLDYLKHTRKNPHTINNFELNDEGKITMLELVTKTL